MTLLTRFAMRHMLRHWRMNLVVLAGLVLTAAFVSSLPPYATAIAGRGLAQRLADAPATARNLLITGEGLNAAFYNNLVDTLGDLAQRRITVYDAAPIDGTSLIFRADGTQEPFAEYLQLNPIAFAGINEEIAVVEGRMPQIINNPPNQFFAEMEAVIGRDTFDNLRFSFGEGTFFTTRQLRVGDELRSANETIRVKIVGVVEPVNPESDIWFDDLRPFGFSRLMLHGPNSPETAVISLIVPPRTATDLFAAAEQWRVLTNLEQVNVDTLDSVQTRVKNAETQINSRGLLLDTSLSLIIETYQAQLNAAQVTLFLLTVQSLLFVLYTLAMISAFVLDQSRSDLVTLVGRGFRSPQITFVFAAQGLLLALLALPLGPLLSQVGLQIWGRLTDTVVPTGMTAVSWQLTAVAIAFGWLTLVVAVFAGTRGSILQWQQARARPPQQAAWQRYYLDLFLLVLGGLVYWQLSDFGTISTQLAQNETLNASGLADPLLLLGPSLLLIAVTLVFLRLFPLLLRLASWLTRRVEGLILPFGLARLARDPVAPSRVVLLVSLAAGLTLFANLFSYSLDVRQQQMAHYLVGADLRVGLPNAAGADAYAAVAALDGVTAVSPVYHNDRSRLADNLGQQAHLLAIDPATFAQVARYAPGISTLSIDTVLPSVIGDGSEPIPAVFSAAAPPTNKAIGDIITYIVGTHRVDFEVRGIIRNFPLVDGAYFVTNLAAVEQAVDLTVLSEPWVGDKEVWTAVAPGQTNAVIRQILDGAGPASATIAADAASVKRTLQSDLVAQEAIGAFNLNALTLTILSVFIFLLVHYFAARQRAFEFSVLRASGLATRQLLGLLSLEGGIMMALGLVAGSGIGYGLAWMMRPFLGQTLTDALGGDTLHQIMINWPATGALYGLLLLFYAAAMLLLLAALLRVGLHQALRLGDE